MPDNQKLETLLEAIRKADQIFFDDEAPEEAKDEAMLGLRDALALFEPAPAQ